MNDGEAGPYSIGSGHWPGLSKLIEECGEVTQVAGKLLGTGGAVEHWDGTDLRSRMAEELGDLLAAVRYVIDKAGMEDVVYLRARIKLALFDRWDREAGSSGVWTGD